MPFTQFPPTVTSYKAVAQYRTQNIRIKTGLGIFPEGSLREPFRAPSLRSHPLNPWKPLICSLLALLSRNPRCGRARVDWTVHPLKGIWRVRKLLGPSSRAAATFTYRLCVNVSHQFSEVSAQKRHRWVGGVWRFKENAKPVSREAAAFHTHQGCRYLDVLSSIRCPHSFLS